MESYEKTDTKKSMGTKSYSDKLQAWEGPAMFSGRRCSLALEFSIVCWCSVLLVMCIVSWEVEFRISCVGEDVAISLSRSHLITFTQHD